jgi:pyridoxamine 5'-phosphate oxidase
VSGVGLDEARVAPDPIAQFRAWLDEATAAGGPEPQAMTLATIAADGAPHARIVYLRGLDERGFAFFTNYESSKGHDLAATPLAALVFFWSLLHRQVRVEGTVAQLSAAESDAYFAQRPRGHRLNAWASQQSSVIPSRAFLEERVADAAARFGAGDVPRPPYWGGYRVTPRRVEFWQGREDRAHDRLAYVRVEQGWRIERLSP